MYTLHIADKIIKVVSEHNHQPDKAKIIADETVNQLKRKAIDNYNSLSELIQSVSA